MMPPPKPYPPLQNGASKNFSPGANKRKNVEPKQSPSGMGKKQKFQNGSSSNGQYASPNSSSEGENYHLIIIKILVSRFDVFLVTYPRIKP